MRKLNVIAGICQCYLGLLFMKTASTAGFCGLCKFCVLMIFNAWGTAVTQRLEKSANDWKMFCSNTVEVLLNKDLNPKPL